MRLFIIRHADPDYPNNTITPAGHKEAESLAIRLKRLGLDKIFVSPLGRALDTCRYTADALEMEPVVLDWTKELDLPLIEEEGIGRTAIWDVNGHTLHNNERGRHIHTGNWYTLPPFNTPDYCESVAELGKHSDTLLAQLGFVRENGIYRVLRPHNKDKIAIFCHGGLGLTWISHLLGIAAPLIWTGFFLPPSSVTTILFDERIPGIATPRALGVGDISHLYATGLPMQPAGIRANAE